MARRSETPPAEGEPAAGARAILRVLNVLTALAVHPAGLSLAELTTRMGVPKASLFRILHTLRQAGYLEQGGGAVRLGAHAFALARMIGEVAPASPFPDCARPVLEWLAEHSGETVMLGVLDKGGDDVAYVTVLESAQPIRFAVGVGDTRPLYSAAAGQAMLAFLPDAARQAYLARADFVAFTPATRDAASLPARLESARQLGVARDDGGRVAGASGMASPVFDAAGVVCAAVSVAGPSERMGQSADRLIPLVREAGLRISRILGFAGAYPAD